ncbi:MAG: divergent polysaccharide deacetylase family protein [Candidatus Latescibacteria bacterium]|nr:divergent polysaccharide deacetylase family protein [Candidatus Latescibacterota bacterium]
MAKKKQTRKPKRMARTQRSFALPVWIVPCVLVLLAGGLAAWFWRPQPQKYLPEVEVETPWRAGPEDVDAFADTMAVQAKHVLIGLGVPIEVIQVVRLPEHRGSHLRWEVRSEIPGVLPLAVCNLALTRLAHRLGGAILEGREDRQGNLLSLRVGLSDKNTDLITLKRNTQLERRAGRIAIVIDDFGYQHQRLISDFCALSQPITLSIFPKEKYTDWAAQQAHRHKHGVMVHLPMEPIDYPARNPGPDAIFSDFAPERIRELTKVALSAVPHARGVNNHMGSRLTQNAEAIAAVLQSIKKQGFFFVDSMTSPKSVAFSLAQDLGIPSGRNALFIDPIEEEDAVVKRLYALAERARHEGTAIGIGHAKYGTLRALQRVLPELEEQGFEFVLAEMAVR